MSDAIPHEGRFLKALGVNPDHVVSESTHLEWKGGHPVLTFTIMNVLDPAVLAGALLAAAQEQAQTEDTGLVEALAQQEKGAGGEGA